MTKIDLKYTKEELSELEGDASQSEKDAYPWGLSINLDKTTLAKLPPEFFTALTIGESLPLTCTVKVESKSEDETTEGVRRSARLQITSFELPEQKPNAAKTLYPDNE